MKQIRLLFSIIVLPIILNAQTKIEFDNTLSISDFLKKAKQEDRYIFIDAYTTWCIPCKQMEKEVFSDKSIGNFMNRNFNNIAIQFDRSTNDDPTVKLRYQEVDFIKSYYKVNVYPTYLFLKPDGKLIYKFEGRTKDKNEFLEIANQALKAEETLLTLRKQYNFGKIDSTLLQNLITSPLIYDEIETTKYIEEFLKNRYAVNRNILPKLFSVTKSSESEIFKAITTYEDQINKIGFGRELVNTIFDVAFNELVYPNLKINGSIERHPGGIILYKGENNPNVNWMKIMDTLTAKYPKYAVDILSKSKISYSIFTKNWRMFMNELDYARKLKSPLFESQIYLQYANEVYNFCDDRETLSDYIKLMQDDIEKLSASENANVSSLERLLEKSKKVN